MGAEYTGRLVNCGDEKLCTGDEKLCTGDEKLCTGAEKLCTGADLNVGDEIGAEKLDDGGAILVADPNDGALTAGAERKLCPPKDGTAALEPD